MRSYGEIEVTRSGWSPSRWKPRNCKLAPPVTKERGACTVNTET